MIRRRIGPALTSRVDPEDILGEAFLRAADRWSSHNPALISTYSWLYRITLDALVATWRNANTAGRAVQREVSWPERSSIQLGLGLVGSTTSPSEAFIKKEQRERIAWAVQQLKNEDREILAMHHFDELSYREVAAILDITEDAAARRYAAGVAPFEAALGKDRAAFGFVAPLPRPSYCCVFEAMPRCPDKARGAEVMIESTATPLSDDPVIVAYLKDLAVTAKHASVVDDYVRRYPDREAELRAWPSCGATWTGLSRPIKTKGLLPDAWATSGSSARSPAAAWGPSSRRSRNRSVEGSPSRRSWGDTRTWPEPPRTDSSASKKCWPSSTTPTSCRSMRPGPRGTLQYFAMSYIDGAALHHVVRTARLHELSSHRNPRHTPTPNLAALAAQAKSVTPSGEPHVPEWTRPATVSRRAQSTTVAMPDVKPLRLGARDDDELRRSTR